MAAVPSLSETPATTTTKEHQRGGDSHPDVLSEGCVVNGPGPSEKHTCCKRRRRNYENDLLEKPKYNSTNPIGAALKVAALGAAPPDFTEVQTHRMFKLKEFVATDARKVVYVEKGVFVHRECFWDELRQFIKSWRADEVDVSIFARGEKVKPNNLAEIPIGRKSVKDVMIEVDEMPDTRDSWNMLFVDIKITVHLQPDYSLVDATFKPIDFQLLQYRGSGGDDHHRRGSARSRSPRSRISRRRNPRSRCPPEEHHNCKAVVLKGAAEVKPHLYLQTMKPQPSRITKTSEELHRCGSRSPRSRNPRSGSPRSSSRRSRSPRRGNSRSSSPLEEHHHCKAAALEVATRGTAPPDAHDIINWLEKTDPFFYFKEFKATYATTVVYVEKDIFVHRKCFWGNLHQDIKSWRADGVDITIIAWGEKKQVTIPIGRKSVKDVMMDVDEQQKEKLDTRDSRNTPCVDIEIMVNFQADQSLVTVRFKPIDLQRPQYRGSGNGQ